MAVITITQPMIDSWNANNVKLYCNDVLVGLTTQINVNDTVTFKCNEGYQFDQSQTNKQPRYVRKRTTGTNSSTQFPTINNENTIASHVIALPTGFSSYSNFTATTVAYTHPLPKFVCYKITQDILNYVASKNCTLTKNNVAVILGTEFYKNDVIKVVANSGFYIASAFLKWYDGEQQVNFITGGVSKSVSVSYTFDYENLYTDLNISSYSLLTSVFEIDQSTLDTLNNNHCKMYKNNSIVNLGNFLYKDDVIKVIPDNGYTIKSAYFQNSSGSSLNFTILDNQASYTILTDNSLTGFDCLAEITIIPPTIRLDYDESVASILTLNNAVMFLNGVKMVIGDKAYNGDILVIKPLSGYELANTPRFSQYSNTLGHGGYVDFTLVNFGVNAELTIDMYSNYFLTDLEVLTTQVDIVAGANTLYKITKSDLKQINIDRFVNSGSNPPTVIDYGTNILGVVNLPFDISPDYIQNPELIKLGTHETTVTAPKIVTDKLYLNLGDISVPMPENSLGFTNANVLIHLPYANSLTLDINAVMGQIISVEYVIDLYNGNSYVNIKSNKSDSIIASSSVDLGINIPYSSMLGDNNTVYNSNMSLGGDNHVKAPYIEIIQNMPILGGGFFTAPITAESNLNNEKGFIQVENINLNVTATSNEKDMILTALRSGVIIND